MLVYLKLSTHIPREEYWITTQTPKSQHIIISTEQKNNFLGRGHYYYDKHHKIYNKISYIKNVLIGMPCHEIY